MSNLIESDQVIKMSGMSDNKKVMPTFFCHNFSTALILYLSTRIKRISQILLKIVTSPTVYRDRQTAGLCCWNTVDDMWTCVLQHKWQWKNTSIFFKRDVCVLIFSFLKLSHTCTQSIASNLSLSLSNSALCSRIDLTSTSILSNIPACQKRSCGAWREGGLLLV